MEKIIQIKKMLKNNWSQVCFLPFHLLALLGHMSKMRQRLPNI